LYGVRPFLVALCGVPDRVFLAARTGCWLAGQATGACDYLNGLWGSANRPGFRIRADPIIAAMGPATRAVLLNSPCNPTGVIVAAEELEILAAACAERGIVLISDETYEHLEFDGEHASVAPLVIAIQGHSTSGPATFAMVAALTALTDAGEEAAAMREEYRQRRDLVLELLAGMPDVDCVPPTGSFYVFPRVDKHYCTGRQGSVAFAEYRLDEARVARRARCGVRRRQPHSDLLFLLASHASGGAGAD
jgi:aspartate/methionine/tyrosine aminotransferase